MGIYLYGWDRLSPRAHWICSFPIWISGIAAAFIIVTVNSWMNAPAGFEVQNGQLVGINSLQAIFNPSQPYEVVHNVKVENAASPQETQTVLLVGIIIALIIVVPSLWFLFYVFKIKKATGAAQNPGE